jgi:hypothetical protein
MPPTLETIAEQITTLSRVITEMGRQVDKKLADVQRELNERLEDVETRLSVKIEVVHEEMKIGFDGISGLVERNAHFRAVQAKHTARLDNHEVRILALESSKPPRPDA